MYTLARATYTTQIELILQQVQPLLEDHKLSNEFKWNILIQPFSDMAHKLHAQRIVRKNTYQRSMLKLESAPDSVLPDYLASQQEKMLDTSALCGFYDILASELRLRATTAYGFKGKNTFTASVKAIEYQIKSETQSTAEYIAKGYTQDKANKQTISLDALKSFNIAC